MPKIPRSSSSQASWRILKSMVLEALVGSVAWLAPPVSLERTQESVVPNASRPRLARSRRPPRSRIHSALVAEK